MTLDVVGIGNAIVDVIAQTEDTFLEKHRMVKGSMALIGPDDAENIYSDMGPANESSGGSAANTIAGIAALGGKAGFMGCVANDQLGEIFKHDITSLGVAFPTAPTTSGTPTARSFILVTPDAERTMNTYLGACVELSEKDVDKDLISRASITYLEGYLWDPEEAKKAFVKAMNIAQEAGNKVALTLSDSFCVDRYRDEFLELVKTKVDILFANEAEIMSLFQADDFDAAISMAQDHLQLAVITRSEKGAVIVSKKEHITVPAHPTTVLDATGAGDLYAAGFLYGYTQGMPLQKCGQIAAITAAKVISQIGARPEGNLRQHVEEVLGEKLP